VYLADAIRAVCFHQIDLAHPRLFERRRQALAPVGANRARRRIIECNRLHSPGPSGPAINGRSLRRFRSDCSRQIGDSGRPSVIGSAAVLAIGPVGPAGAAVDIIVAVVLPVPEQLLAIGAGLVAVVLVVAVGGGAGDAAGDGAGRSADRGALSGVAVAGVVADDGARGAAEERAGGRSTLSGASACAPGGDGSEPDDPGGDPSPNPGFHPGLLDYLWPVTPRSAAGSGSRSEERRVGRGA